MSIETHLSELTAAITANTTALREILAAGATATPTNVVPITETPKGKPGRPPKAAAVEPEPTPEPEPVEERPTKVPASAPAQDEFSDPLDPETTVVVKGSVKIDVDATIAECIETFKAKMAAANDDPARKAALKDEFPKLRNKWGLKPDDKLITLAPTPEKLVGLLEDIKAL